MHTQVKIQEEETLMRENKKKDVSREFTQTIQAIRNLFGRCYSTMSVNSIFAGPRENTMSLTEVLDMQLDVISARMVDLIEITQEYNQAALCEGSLGHGSLSIIDRDMPSVASLPQGAITASASKSITSIDNPKRK